MAAVLRSVDLHGDLMRMAIATPGASPTIASLRAHAHTRARARGTAPSLLTRRRCTAPGLIIRKCGTAPGLLTPPPAPAHSPTKSPPPAGNDFRLGACEAPPVIISTYLGDDVTNYLEEFKNTKVVL